MHITEMKMMVEPVAEPDTGTKNILFYAAGPLLGLLIAFAFSLLAETLDHSLRTPVEVEKYLGKPVLAVLPRMDVPKGTQKRLASNGESAPPVLPSS
jgi:capsular polysaccharide biosynthesis protein